MGHLQVIVPEETINWVTNPSCEIDDAGYSIWSGAATTETTADAVYGVKCLEITPAAGVYSGVLYTTTAQGANGYPVTFSCYVKGYTGISYRIFFGDAAGNVKAGCTPTTFTGDGEWHRYEVTWTADNDTVRPYLTKNNTADVHVFYSDAWQVEIKSYATTYCDGDQPGCEWRGRKHEFSSHRSKWTRGGGRPIDWSTTFNIEVDVLSGMSMPPITVNSTPYSLLPGGFPQGQKAQPRVINLSCHSNTNSEATMYQARQYLVDAMRIDASPVFQPVILRYTGSTTTVECVAVYDTGLEGSYKETCYSVFGLRFIAFDPYWYEIGEKHDELTIMDSLTFYMVAARWRDTGAWSAMSVTQMPTSSSSAFAIYDIKRGPDGHYYIAGDFIGWDGVAGVDFVARYDPFTDTWNRVGGASAFGSPVYALEFGPDGTLYAGGSFGSAEGNADAANLAKIGPYDAAWSPVAAGGSGSVRAIKFGGDGNLYFGGTFTNWAADADIDYLGYWDGTSYNPVGGGGGTGNVYSIDMSFAGALAIGGAFTDWAGVTGATGVAVYDAATWVALSTGTDDTVNELQYAPNGALYIVGAFDTAGDVTCNGFVLWDGRTFIRAADGTGVNNSAICMGFTPDSHVMIGGNFTTAGQLSQPVGGLARWNGYSWCQVDLYNDTPPTWRAIEIGPAEPVCIGMWDMVVGCGSTLSAATAGVVTVTNEGTAAAFPRIRIKASGGIVYLYQIRNESTGKSLYFDLQMVDGETITIDLTQGKKSITSDYRGGILRSLLPNSDLAEWALYPGENIISVYSYTEDEPSIEAYIIWRNTHWSVEGVA